MSPTRPLGLLDQQQSSAATALTHDLRIYPAPAPPATNREIDEFELAQQLVGLQEAAESSSPAEQQQVLQSAQAAADQINLDEAETRALVDEQLRERGWEADTQSLRYAKGVRPARGKAMAIAEWPTANGPADYALFVGLTCVGLVEAKRKRKNVAAAIDQTGPTEEKPFRVPFLFVTNGRPFLKQVETQSGIWFCDARDPTNLRRALTDWPTPEGLKAQLDIDRQAAQERLQSMPIEFARPPPTAPAREPNTVTFDSRSEEGEILIRWGFRPKVLGYIPNVRGAVTGVP